MNNKVTFLVIAFFITAGFYAQQTQDPQIQAAKTEILGEWIRTDCSTCKLIFTNDMKQKYYIDGELMWTYQYDLDWVCEAGQLTMDSRLMLITLDENSNRLSCDIIQTLNDDDSVNDILSITTGQGKLIVYERP